MGKQKRKGQNVEPKKSKWDRTCERCGNENFSRKPVFKCKHCKAWNGVGGRVLDNDFAE